MGQCFTKTEKYMRGRNWPNQGQREVDVFRKRRGAFVIRRKVHDNGKATAVELAVQGPFVCVTLCGRYVAEEEKDGIPCDK